MTIGQLEANNTAGIFAANNGLNTVDALKIRQHLLAVAPLPAPYALIAADVDNNGSLSLVDESLVKKVILGIDLEFANVPSWRFLPRYFLDPQWNFNIAFESNPFTASIQWQDNTTRGYNTTPAYLDDLDITVLSEDLADAGSWSFYAIKSGDVDFTANISAGGAMTLSARESGTSLEVLPHTAIPAGSTFTITVEAKTQKLTAAYQMGMQFDPSAFEILSLSKGEVDNFDLDDFGLQKASEGVFKTVWVEDKGRGMSFANKKKVFKIYCRAKQNIENLDRLIHLDDDILQNAFYDHKGNLIDAEIYLTVEPEEVTTVLKGVYPNPTSAAINFRFALLKPGEINITISDRNNRTLTHKATYQEGEFTYTFANTSDLASGAINYTLTLDNHLYYAGQVIKF